MRESLIARQLEWENELLCNFNRRLSILSRRAEEAGDEQARAVAKQRAAGEALRLEAAELAHERLLGESAVRIAQRIALEVAARVAEGEP